jgi:hypothetical protein
MQLGSIGQEEQNAEEIMRHQKIGRIDIRNPFGGRWITRAKFLGAAH